MSGVNNFIRTVKRIERGYNMFLKIMKYADKAMAFYPVVGSVLKKFNTSDND